MARRSSRLGRWAVIVVLIVAGGTAAWFAAARDKPAARGGELPRAEESKSSRAVSVDVVSPRPGGIDRLCTQPGSIEPLQAADVYAKVSGYLTSQTLEREQGGDDGRPVAKPVLIEGKPVQVDIGTLVEAGDILARISVPEYEKQAVQDEADVTRAEAKIEQMTAAIATAEADLGAATAAVASAQAEVKSKTSYRMFREKQRDRIRDLASRNSIDRKLEDEQEDQYQAAVSAELAAVEAVNAAKQKETAAASRIKQAKADLKYASAEVTVAKARLARSRVLLDYTVIRAPYTGVVTRRTFQPGRDGRPGDFIRSADQGAAVPLFSVERTDVMRVVVQVPERDVPFVEAGDAAEVVVDALPGVSFKTAGNDRVEVARLAKSEDPHTRMMRVEIDVKNPTGKLRRGMYGRVTITLQAGSPESVRVPSEALVGKAEAGKASVRVVRDDVVQVVPVRYGIDNGTEVEVVSGLTAADRVVVRASGPVDNGTQVVMNTGGQGGRPSH